MKVTFSPVVKPYYITKCVVFAMEIRPFTTIISLPHSNCKSTALRRNHPKAIEPPTMTRLRIRTKYHLAHFSIPFLSDDFFIRALACTEAASRRTSARAGQFDTQCVSILSPPPFVSYMSRLLMSFRTLTHAGQIAADRLVEV